MNIRNRSSSYYFGREFDNSWKGDIEAVKRKLVYPLPGLPPRGKKLILSPWGK